MGTLRVALVVLTVLGGLLLPARALACSCTSKLIIFPPEGPVPPNLAIYVGEESVGGRLELLNEQDQQVPLNVAKVNADLVRMTPVSPLEPGKRYKLKHPSMDYEQYPIYTVQGGPDVTPPAPPTSASASYVRDVHNALSMCTYETNGYTLRVRGAQDDRAELERLGTLVVLASAPEQVLGLLLPGQELLGRRYCSSNFDTEKWGGSKVALRSVDPAGNVSAPGATVRLAWDLPLLPGVVFYSTPGRVFLALCMAAVIAIVLLSRRKARE